MTRARCLGCGMVLALCRCRKRFDACLSMTLADAGVTAA